MKKSILYSLVIFLFVFLGGCEKDEPYEDLDPDYRYR